MPPQLPEESVAGVAYPEELYSSSALPNLLLAEDVPRALTGPRNRGAEVVPRLPPR